jgi:hypothetical protein
VVRQKRLELRAWPLLGGFLQGYVGNLIQMDANPVCEGALVEACRLLPIGALLRRAAEVNVLRSCGHGPVCTSGDSPMQSLTGLVRVGTQWNQTERAGLSSDLAHKRTTQMSPALPDIHEPCGGSRSPPQGFRFAHEATDVN